MHLVELVRTSERVASSSGRLDKIAALAELLGRLEPGEVPVAVAWLSGATRQGKLGLGPAAVRATRDVPPADSPSLTIREVDEAFARIASDAGPGSVARRTEGLAALLRRATAGEQALLRALVVGELRQGALAGLLVEAVARAAAVPANDVRRALMLAGELPEVAGAALADGRAGLGRFRLELFRPLQPMLAQPAGGVEAALERLGTAALEYKLDGARVQLHRDGDEVRVYTRRLNDVTAAVPELVELARGLPARRLLLDGEVLAFAADGTPRPFQQTMRRFGRRSDVERLRRELPLTPLFFDLLHLDGEDLIDRPAGERFDALAGMTGLPGDRVVPRLVTADPEAAQAFYDEAIARGHEGLLAKDPAAAYAAGGRGFGWLKVKPAHTLDLVVLAAEWGSGRRRGWLSNLHLGARDPVTGDFVMLGKTFKGMTDEMLAWQTVRLRELATRDERHVVRVRPELVVEVAFSNVQHSPHYPAGLVLRFARIKRYRLDKSPTQADTIESVRALA